MIEIHGLVKTFGARDALAGLSLKVERGEFVTLVGPNGAGKTTLMRILAMLTRPSSGMVRVAGLDLVKAGDEVRRQVGFLSHRTLLYKDVTAEQNLRFYARMYDLGEASRRIQELLDRVGLSSRRSDLVRTFSRGMQQRLAVARTMLHRPRLLLLDEPYAGLDPWAAQILTGLIQESIAEGGTVLLTTHNLELGLALGQRVVVLTRGRLIYDEERDHIDLTTLLDVYYAHTR